MEEKRYTKHVGVKFNTDGSFKKYLGNTIICPLSNTVYIDEIMWVQEQYKKLAFSYKYAFLPESSMHMTAMDLVCDQNREQSRWTSLLPLSESLDNVNCFFSERLRDIEFPTDIWMEVEGVSPIRFSLKPNGDANTRILKDFRNAVSKTTGVRHKNHDNYKFHISLSYLLIELTDNEKNELEEVNKMIYERISRKMKTINVGRPVFTLFDDMSLFVPFNSNVRE